MDGDRITGRLDALRDEMTLEEKWALHDVMKCIRRFKADLEELGVDVTVVEKDTPPDERRGVVLHLTAIIRKELEEERRGFRFEGDIVLLTLTELQGRLSGSPTKHVLAVWEGGVRGESRGSTPSAKMEVRT